MGTRQEPTAHKHAGTPLHAATPIKFTIADGKEETHGYVSEDGTVFQGGGVLEDIINFQVSPPLMSMMWSVWTTTRKVIGCEVWEMIEKRTGRCYRITFDKAAKMGHRYKTAKGVRWGVPTNYVDIIKPDGSYERVGDDPPPPPVLVFGESDPKAFVPVKVKRAPKAEEPQKLRRGDK